MYVVNTEDISYRWLCVLTLSLLLHVTAVEVSHAFVAFLEEDDHPTCIVPVKRFKNYAVQDLKKGEIYSVEWTDKQVYPAEVIDMGKYLLLLSMYSCPCVWIVTLYI